MTIDIEFLCLDMRPLKRRKEYWLLAFLKPLHQNNYAIKAIKEEPLAHSPFYRHVGALTTSGLARRSYFQARNTIRFPNFVEHNLTFKSSGEEYTLRRGDSVRRHFSTDDFGVTNRLKLGFQFNLKGKNKFQSDKNTYDCIKFILGIDKHKIKVTTDSGGNKKKDRSMIDLGEEWMRDIILHSTKNKWFRRIGFRNKRKNVQYVATTVVVTYEKGEFQYLPKGTLDFEVSKYPEPIKMSFFVPRKTKKLQVYFIEYEKNCDKKFLNNLRLHLLDQRTNYLCLEHAFLKISMNNEKQREFVDNLMRKKDRIKNKTRYGFFDLGDNDEGEICDSDKRKQINERYKLLTSTIATVS